jgi:hypothetical protein
MGAYGSDGCELAGRRQGSSARIPGGGEQAQPAISGKIAVIAANGTACSHRGGAAARGARRAPITGATSMPADPGQGRARRSR